MNRWSSERLRFPSRLYDLKDDVPTYGFDQRQPVASRAMPSLALIWTMSMRLSLINPRSLLKRFAGMPESR